MMRRTSLALAVACGLAAMSSYADEQPAQPGADATLLPEVKVQAATSAELSSEDAGGYAVKHSSAPTGLELSLRETPQSVSVIAREQIEDFSLDSVNDVLDQATGIVVERVETDRTYYTARGSDVTSFQLDGIGLPLNFGLQTGNVDVAVYDRVEVIRGANGLLSPTGNPSATINFVRKRPTADFRAGVDLTAGSWNDRRVEADVSGSLTSSGNVRGRAVAVAQQRDSYLDRYEHEKQVLYGVLEVDLGPDTLLTLGHTYQKNAPDSPLWGALPLLYSDGGRINYDVSASSSADWAYWDSDDNRTFVELAHEFVGGWQAKAVLTRREAHEDGKMFYTFGTPQRSDGSGMFTFPSTYLQDNLQWLADFQARGPFSLAGREHQLVVGASWARSDLHSESRYGSSAFSPITLDEVLAGSSPDTSYPAVSGRADIDDERHSLYAAVKFNLTDRLDLIGGARTTSVESRGASYGVPHKFEHNDQVSPYAGVVYALTPQHSAYASYTEIFNPQSEVDIDRQPLAPLEGKNYEVGLKSEWLGGGLISTLALFRTKQDNVAEAVGFIPGSFDTYYRGVSATSKGLEVDVAGDVTDRLQLRGGYTALSIEDEHGKDIKTYTPRHLFNLAATWRVPMVERLKVGASVNWRGDIHKQVNGVRVQQDSYALVDLMARYDFSKRLGASLNLYNVTDRKYLSSLQWDQSFYGAPRHASLTLHWDY